MYFYREKSPSIWKQVFIIAISYCGGISLSAHFNIPPWAALLICLGVYFLSYLIYRLRIKISPLRQIERKIKKENNEYSKIKIFIDEYLPESKNQIPSTIYKYVALLTKNDEDSEETKTEKENKNNQRLSSLKNNQLWNARSDKFNDPFEKHPYLYDWNIDKLMMDWNMSWLEYTNDLHNHTYLCSFSETNTSISMWAHYANGFQGYCLEYEVLDAKDLWQVTYDWGRHRFGYEYTEINFAYQNNIISKEERDYQLQTLHKFWSSFKSHDWEYEKEVRAIHYYPDTDSYGVNIDISDIGLKIKSIIIGWDCSDYNREKLIAIANNLNIPIKLAELNMSGTENTRYIKISDYFNESVDKNNHSNQEKALK